MTKSKTCGMKPQLWAFLSFLVFAGGQSAFAGEPVVDLLKETKAKTQLITQLTARYEKHSRLPFEKIQAELLADLAQNREKLRTQGKLSDGMIKLLNQSEETIRSLHSKDEVLTLEETTLHSMVSSANFVFAITKMAMYGLGREETVYESSTYKSVFHPGPLAFQILAGLITVPLDLALLIPQIIISAATGF